MHNRLAEVRKRQGISQLRLAYLTGIQPAEISRIETGRLRPYPGWRKRIARALKVSEAALFPEDGDGR
ncbi:MAG: helix-turn-helix transcriptional regulator [Dehalococcoidia bacterium]